MFECRLWNIQLSRALSWHDSEIKVFKDITIKIDKLFPSHGDMSIPACKRILRHSLLSIKNLIVIVGVWRCRLWRSPWQHNNISLFSLSTLWCLWPTQQVTTKSIANSTMNDFLCANFQSAFCDKIYHVYSHNYDYVTCHMFLTCFLYFSVFLFCFIVGTFFCVVGIVIIFSFYSSSQDGMKNMHAWLIILLGKVIAKDSFKNRLRTELFL